MAAKGVLGDLNPLGDGSCRSLAYNGARVPKILPAAELEGSLIGLMVAMATSTVRVIHFSSQNCIQADIQSARPLPHMNLNVSERLICTLRGLSRLTDRVTG